MGLLVSLLFYIIINTVPGANVLAYLVLGELFLSLAICKNHSISPTAVQFLVVGHLVFHAPRRPKLTIRRSILITGPMVFWGVPNGPLLFH